MMTPITSRNDLTAYDRAIFDRLAESQDCGAEVILERLESPGRIGHLAIGDALNDLIIACFEAAAGSRGDLVDHLRYVTDQLGKARDAMAP